MHEIFIFSQYSSIRKVSTLLFQILAVIEITLYIVHKCLITHTFLSIADTLCWERGRQPHNNILPKIPWNQRKTSQQELSETSKLFDANFLFTVTYCSFEKHYVTHYQGNQRDYGRTRYGNQAWMGVRRPVMQGAPRRGRQPSRRPEETEKTSARLSWTSSCEYFSFTVTPWGCHLPFQLKYLRTDNDKLFRL